MRAFKYSNKLEDIIAMLQDSLKNPGMGYTPDNETHECKNLPEVIKSVKTFIELSEKYGWYRHFLAENKLDHLPEVNFNLAKVVWNEDKACWHMTLMINPQMLIVIDTNYMFASSYVKSYVICRKRNCDELPKALLEKGIKEVRYPQSLVVASGIFSQVFGPLPSIYIKDNIVTYSLARLKIPQVPEEDLPLYIHANPVVKESINYGRLSEGKNDTI